MRKPSPRKRKQMEPQKTEVNLRRSSATENRAGREEQPEGVHTYILSLLVTTVMTPELYEAPSQRTRRQDRFATILTSQSENRTEAL